jgi:hypothetical protein
MPAIGLANLVQDPNSCFPECKYYTAAFQAGPGYQFHPDLSDLGVDFFN